MNLYPHARRSDLVLQKSGDETLIYDLNSNRALCLNETSTMIWKLCDGFNSVDNIRLKVSNKMKAPVSDDFIWLALTQLSDDGLLVDKIDAGNRFDGLSRREAVRKIGMTAAVSLPMVAAIAAPTAAFAQSACTNPQDPCMLSGECCSGTCSVSTCCVTLGNPCNVPNDCCNNPMICAGGICVIM